MRANIARWSSGCRSKSANPCGTKTIYQDREFTTSVLYRSPSDGSRSNVALYKSEERASALRSLRLRVQVRCAEERYMNGKSLIPTCSTRNTGARAGKWHRHHDMTACLHSPVTIRMQSFKSRPLQHVEGSPHRVGDIIRRSSPKAGRTPTTRPEDDHPSDR